MSSPSVDSVLWEPAHGAKVRGVLAEMEAQAGICMMLVLTLSVFLAPTTSCQLTRGDVQSAPEAT